MTTDIRVVSMPDILVCNEVFNIRYKQEHAPRKLSGASFSVLGESTESLVAILIFIWELIAKKLSGYDTSITIGWLPNK